MLLNYNVDLRSISSVVFDTAYGIGTLADLKQCIVDWNLKVRLIYLNILNLFLNLE